MSHQGGLMQAIDHALIEEWKTTIEAAVQAYHDITDVDKLEPDNETELRNHQNLVEQLATYFTTHQMDYLDTKGLSPKPQDMWRTDEVDDELIARFYHLLQWQATEYGIWSR